MHQELEALLALQERDLAVMAADEAVRALYLETWDALAAEP